MYITEELNLKIEDIFHLDKILSYENLGGMLYEFHLDAVFPNDAKLTVTYFNGEACESTT